METGSELSKTVAIFIVQKILLDDIGLAYICQTYERFYAVGTVLSNMVNQLVEQQTVRLLKHVVRCFLRYDCYRVVPILFTNRYLALATMLALARLSANVSRSLSEMQPSHLFYETMQQPNAVLPSSSSIYLTMLLTHPIINNCFIKWV